MHRGGDLALLSVLLVLASRSGKAVAAEESTWDVIVDYLDDAWFLVCFVTGIVVVITWIVVCCCICRIRRRNRRDQEQLLGQNANRGGSELTSLQLSTREMTSKETLGIDEPQYSAPLRGVGSRKTTVTLHKNRDSVVGFTLAPCGEEDEPGVVVDVVKAGSDADRSGLQAGDRLVAVNGRSFFGLTTQQAFNVLTQVHGTLRVQVERRDQQSQIAHTATDLSAYIPRHDDDDNDGDDDDGDDDDGGSGRDRLGRNAEGGSMHVHFAFPVDDSSATSGGGDKSAGQDTWPEAMDQMEPPTFEDSHIRHSTTGDRLVFVGGERVPPPPSRRAPTRPTPTPAATRPAPAPRPRPRPRNRPSAGGASSSSSLLLDASGGGSGAAADSMDVTILNNATHEHMSFTAFAATTVRDIKSYLLRAFDIPIDCQVLTLGDTELTSGARVFALGMNADDVIVLNTRDYTAM